MYCLATSATASETLFLTGVFVSEARLWSNLVRIKSRWFGSRVRKISFILGLESVEEGSLRLRLATRRKRTAANERVYVEGMLVDDL